jgi:hypothetical protein
VSPGPLKELLDVRLALSKEDLNTREKPSFSDSSFKNLAVLNVVSQDSITHGPAMIKNGSSSPNSIEPIFVLRTWHTSEILNLLTSNLSGVRDT